VNDDIDIFEDEGGFIPQHVATADLIMARYMSALTLDDWETQDLVDLEIAINAELQSRGRT